ncbi:FAD/NAD(P)-binding domain-containing protein [Pseudomassariella vexata]|uniref:FAD/NAD(P)-binding domain-containing protein n=1 Tax=Pseudomassariella vexata TaxID=1141098 RepID=A0A1Y2EJI6_9PEZI|nr:FAD/NAD(P)-binding domain-containing protein [Pseudomassariella vexata]ORY71722.1 FAD/NAD(P)-binding domain-containing protein [Pseudomassariella vexata]
MRSLIPLARKQIIVQLYHYHDLRPQPASSLANMGSVSKDIPGPFNIQNIAIIGAGPSGLAAAKYLQAQEAFNRIVVLEQQANVGGVWNYSATPSETLHVPQTSALCPPDPPLKRDGKGGPVFPSPMYERLHTNIPHTLMQFSDLGFLWKGQGKEEDEVKIFPTREVVQQYLEEYAISIRELIRFSTSVDDVQLRVEEGRDQWDVRSRDLITGQKRQETYDAVVVATGHYATTYMPDIPGIREFDAKHRGVISHSKLYRTPGLYEGKKVVVVGNAASGLDIASQILKVCRPPLFVSVREETPKEIREAIGFDEVAEIENFLVEEKGLQLKDGRVITDVDFVLFCTGYLFSFPFFESMDPPLVTNGRRVYGLYKQLVHIQHPTLVFPGLPIKAIPFPLSEAQAAVYARIWANALELPSRETMKEWERKEAERNGPAFHVFPKGADGAYINEMHDWAMLADGKGKEPPRWDEEALWQRGIYTQAKMEFERTGMKATTLVELGFKYEPAKGEAKPDRNPELEFAG